MTLIVGSDRHPASKEALAFAGRLGSALHEDLHVVHVHDLGDTHIAEPAVHAHHARDASETVDRGRIGAALNPEGVQWTFSALLGDPVMALLDAADTLSASMIVVGRPEHGLGATLGHLVTSAVARTLIRRSPVPIVIVPELTE